MYFTKNKDVNGYIMYCIIVSKLFMLTISSYLLENIKETVRLFQICITTITFKDFTSYFFSISECLHLCREEREKIIDSLETNSDEEDNRKDDSGDDGITDEEEKEDEYQWNTLTQNQSEEENGTEILSLLY